MRDILVKFSDNEKPAIKFNESFSSKEIKVLEDTIKELSSLLEKDSNEFERLKKGK